MGLFESEPRADGELRSDGRGRRSRALGVTVIAVSLTLSLLVHGGCRLGYDDPYSGDWPDPSVKRMWREVHQLENPGRLFQPRMTYHAGRRTVLLYGGEQNLDAGENIISDQLWELDGYVWRRLCHPCGPGPRIGHGLAYDHKRDRLILFGGQDDEGAIDGELWEWDGVDTWELRDPAGEGPTPRHSVLMAYDPVGERTLVYGGALDGGGESSELFAYDGEGWRAIEVSDPWPGNRLDPSTPAVFDPYQGRFIFYGGFGTTYHDDMWAYDGQAWTELCAECTGAGRSVAGLVFDLASGRVVLFNGYGGREIAGTWEWDGDAFGVTFPDVPGPRDSLGATYDEARHRIVGYGGDGVSCNSPQHCDALIELVLEQL